MLISSGSYCAEKIYKVVKPDGTVLYTDKPVPGAELVELNNHLTVAPSLASTNKDARAKGVRVIPKKPVPTIEITSPSQEQTIRNNLGEVTVLGKISSAYPGSYQLLLNNEVVDTNSVPQFELTALDRGAHKIQISLIDNKGKQLALSSTVTFYLHKASINNR